MRSLVGRWSLLALLVLGVVFMHHAPVGHSAMSAPASAAVSVSHHAHAMKPGESVPAADTTAETVVTASTAVDAAHVAGHDVLHMCLAILVAAAALLAFLVLRLWMRPAEVLARSVIRAGIERFPPPVPVPRKLAALCVFRL